MVKLTKEIETAFTEGQKKVEQWLNEWGYECSQERILKPFTCDIFLDKLKICVEVDGPWHYPKRDKKRDNYLLEIYGVRTFRIAYDDVLDKNKNIVMEKFEEWLKKKQ